MTNFRLFQTLEFADDSFKYDENGIQFFKWTDNEQFLLFSQYFQKTFTADT